MGVNFLPVVSIVLYISFTIACYLKLKYYGVKSKYFYILTPLYPFIVLFGTFYSILIYNGKDTKNKNRLILIIYTMYFLISKIPILIGLLCLTIKDFETKNCISKSKNGLKTQKDIYAEATVSYYKKLTTV